MDYCCST